jgi:hypothetical protein
MAEHTTHRRTGRAGALLAVYLSRQDGGRFSLALGIGGGLALAGPLLVGLRLGHLVFGIIAGLGGWLVYLGEPSGDTRARVTFLSRRALLCSLATWLGALTTGTLWATVPLIAASALFVPLRWFGPTPMLCLVFGATMGGLTPAQHGWTFLAGAAWAVMLLLIPVFGGRPDAPAPRRARTAPLRRARSALTELRSAVRGGSPEFHYAVRLAVCFSLAFTVVEYTGLPHANWMLTGIVTTMRPTWEATAGRIVKRMGGQVLGAALGGVLLALCAGLPPAGLAVVAGLCGALARPARRVNYGFWPIFGVPAMLLLLSLEMPEGWTDAAERVGNNLLGAALAAAAMLLLWPPHEERGIPGQVRALLDTHAAYLERVASLAERDRPAGWRLRRLHAAESAERSLRASRNRLAAQHRPDRQLIAELDQSTAAAAELRAGVRAHHPYQDGRLEPAALRGLAAVLRASPAVPATEAVPAAEPEPESHVRIRIVAEQLAAHAARAARISESTRTSRIPRASRSLSAPRRDPSASGCALPSCAKE